MKKLIVLCLMMAMLMPQALAEENAFDNAALEQTENCYVFLADNGVDTVVRPINQPYMGELEAEDTELIAYLDYVEMPGEDMTLLRLLFALTVPERLAANEVTVTVGKTDYVFSVAPVISEYDTTYYEDYALYMTDEGLPMIKAIARAKNDSFTVRFAGSETMTGMITLPKADVAAIYDRYIDLGGERQGLEWLREQYPVNIADSSAK